MQKRQNSTSSYDTSSEEIEGTCLNIIKATYDKPTANIILNGEKMEIISSKVRNEERSLLSPLLFIIVQNS
jgi:hypothetical protein